MANFFTENLQNLHSATPNMEQITHFNDQNFYDLNYHNQNLMPFSSDNFFGVQLQEAAEFPGNLMENFPGVPHQTNLSQQQRIVPALPQSSVTTENETQDSKKRKSMDVSESSFDLNSNSSSASETPIKRPNISGKKKTVKNNKKEEEKPKEVVHVRARRGQATDSHSLAERVRRSKINERLRCLQDIVPGCYKTMGMAVMLDEIINYVQSLQNQVEFLSMKLAAASAVYDFNSEANAIETMQRAKANEIKELEKLVREGNIGGGHILSNSTLPF